MKQHLSLAMLCVLSILNCNKIKLGSPATQDSAQPKSGYAMMGERSDCNISGEPVSNDYCMYRPGVDAKIVAFQRDGLVACLLPASAQIPAKRVPTVRTDLSDAHHFVLEVHSVMPGWGSDAIQIFSRKIDSQKVVWDVYSGDDLAGKSDKSAGKRQCPIASGASMLLKIPKSNESSLATNHSWLTNKHSVLYLKAVRNISLSGCQLPANTRFFAMLSKAGESVAHTTSNNVLLIYMGSDEASAVGSCARYASGPVDMRHLNRLF